MSKQINAQPNPTQVNLSEWNSTEHDETILVYGHFSTIHPGHIRFLRHAKSLGKTLIVALIGDKPTKSQVQNRYSQSSRAEALSLLRIIDIILLLSGDELDQAIKLIKPDILFLGSEMKKLPYILSCIGIINNQGGRVEFHGNDAQYVSTDLLSSSSIDIRKERVEKFKSMCKKYSITPKNLLGCIDNFSKSRILVIGDTIIDQFVACEALGISAEAPVVVVRELANKNFLGAAGIVAAHIKSIGCKCELVSIVGNDDAGKFAQTQMEEICLGGKLFIDKSRPTTFKKRYMVDNQKLFRVSRLEETNISSDLENQIINYIEMNAYRFDAIVISDFVYGVITPKIIASIKSYSVKYSLPIIGDLQCSSQVGSILKFKDFTLLCPNERELRIALQDKDSALEVLSQNLIAKTNSEKLIVKLAGEGFIFYHKTSEQSVISDAFPALSVNPVDVAGAGDSVLAVMAAGLASKQDDFLTCAIACCMAQIAVETMGNTPVTKKELKNSITEILS